jgi:hypothetical protein
MIVDCHCRIWESPAQLGPAASAWLERCGGQPNLSTDPAEYAATATDVGMTLLWGFRSKLLGAEIPNSFLADFAAQRPDQLKAVAAIDPTQDDYPERLENIAERKEFAGLPPLQHMRRKGLRVLPGPQAAVVRGSLQRHRADGGGRVRPAVPVR